MNLPSLGAQVAGPDLRMRMTEFGAVAAVQPSFVPSDAAVVMKRLRYSPVRHAYRVDRYRVQIHTMIHCLSQEWWFKQELHGKQG